MTDEELLELEEYTRYEGSEIGDVCNLLISLHSYPDYLSSEFKEALEKEMKEQLINFKENCKIVEREIPGYTIKELEWKF